MEANTQVHFRVHGHGSIRFGDRVCVPNAPNLEKEIMEEAHFSGYSVHPGSTKMYKDLKRNFWWNNMKREIAQFVAQYLTCQQVKIGHQRPVGLLQSLLIL